MLLGCMRNMVIFPSNAKQIIAIIARIIKLERWYNWGVLQFFDISNYIILCEILLTHWSVINFHSLYVCVNTCAYVWWCVCTVWKML